MRSPGHAAAVTITRASVFLARLGQWERVDGGEQPAAQEPWAIKRLVFAHCKMKPARAEFAFAVDVSAVYERKRQALACYGAIYTLRTDRLLALYEAEDRYYGSLCGVAHAEVFRAAAPLLFDDPDVFAPALHG